MSAEGIQLVSVGDTLQIDKSNHTVGGLLLRIGRKDTKYGVLPGDVFTDNRKINSINPKIPSITFKQLIAIQLSKNIIPDSVIDDRYSEIEFIGTQLAKQIRNANGSKAVALDLFRVDEVDPSKFAPLVLVAYLGSTSTDGFVGLSILGFHEKLTTPELIRELPYLPEYVFLVL
jgi:hypothetical protein